MVDFFSEDHLIKFFMIGLIQSFNGSIGPAVSNFCVLVFYFIKGSQVPKFMIFTFMMGSKLQSIIC